MFINLFCFNLQCICEKSVTISMQKYEIGNGAARVGLRRELINTTLAFLYRRAFVYCVGGYRHIQYKYQCAKVFLTIYVAETL